MGKLKRCPFCGGKALGPTDAWPHMITCEQCGAGVKGFRFGDEGAEEAVEKWERRAPGGLDDAEIVDAEPVKYGVWVPIDDEPHEDFECSVCGYVSTASFDCSGITPNAFPYCPMCGAKMGGGDIDEYAQS